MIKSNRNPEDVKNARNLALREGAETAGYALLSYGLVKLSVIGGKRAMELIGLKLSTNAMKWVEGSIAAVVAAIAVGAITYFKLRRMGYGRKDALKEAGKASGVSFAIAMISLFFSINAGMSWAIGFNVIIAIGSVSLAIYAAVREKQLAERLQTYTIQEIAKRCLPIAA